MTSEKKTNFILGTLLLIAILFIFYTHFSSSANSRVFDETNRISRETIEDLRENNRVIIQAIAGIGNITEELRAIESAYDELNRQREEELRRREELEIVAGELNTAVGERIQRAFDIISEGQRELDSLRE